jgi:hypothetical protein
MDCQRLFWDLSRFLSPSFAPPAHPSDKYFPTQTRQVQLSCWVSRSRAEHMQPRPVLSATCAALEPACLFRMPPSEIDKRVRCIELAKALSQVAWCHAWIDVPKYVPRPRQCLLAIEGKRRKKATAFPTSQYRSAMYYWIDSERVIQMYHLSCPQPAATGSIEH